MESCLIRDVAKPFHEPHHKFLTLFKRLRIPRDKGGDSCIPHYILESDKTFKQEREMAVVRSANGHFWQKSILRALSAARTKLFVALNLMVKNSPRSRTVLAV